MKFYTVEEIADVFSISTSTIRRLLRSGELKGSKLGNQWRISEKQAQEYFDKNSN